MADNVNITYTINHEYSKPGRAKSNWDQDLRALIDELDKDIMLRGVDSAKAEYDATDGALYLATDTENLYLGTGNQWERLDSTGGNPSFGHAEADRVTINDAPSSATDAVRKQELDDVEQSAGGATEDAEYVTISDASDALPNSQSHADITADADLHDPKSHDHAGESLSPETIAASDLSADGVVELGGVRFWFSATEPAEAAEDDVWVETDS